MDTKKLSELERAHKRITYLEKKLKDLQMKYERDLTHVNEQYEITVARLSQHYIPKNKFIASIEQ
jgi:hypothetical protein